MRAIEQGIQRLLRRDSQISRAHPTDNSGTFSLEPLLIADRHGTAIQPCRKVKTSDAQHLLININPLFPGGFRISNLVRTQLREQQATQNPGPLIFRNAREERSYRVANKGTGSFGRSTASQAA